MPMNSYATKILLKGVWKLKIFFVGLHFYSPDMPMNSYATKILLKGVWKLKIFLFKKYLNWMAN